MKTKTTTRRAILAGIAAAPALAAPALALSIAGPDAADWNPKAALARLEQVIETLRTCVVCDGWHPNGLDEAAAARAIAYFRAGLPEQSDHDFAERDAAFEFISGHGQSLDWIVCGDVGGMICGAAKLSKRAQSGTDPILAAIEAHRRANARHEQACEARSHLEDHRPEVNSAPEAVALKREVAAASDESEAAALVLLDVAPTTIAGCAALLRYSNEHTDDWAGDFWPDDLLVDGADDDDGRRPWSFFLQAHVAGALERIAADRRV